MPRVCKSTNSASEYPCEMSVDTFSDVPPQFLNQLAIQQLFDPFKQMAGIVIAGVASPRYGGDAEWGAPLRLTQEESLQIRIHPRGCFSAGKILEFSGVVMIAARRTSHIGQRENVSLAILWNSPKNADMQRNLNHDSTAHQTVGCRNLHILLPNLFNHHDEHAHQNPGRIHTKWPVLDEYNFHAVRPSSVTITQNPTLGVGSPRFSMSAGVSQFVVAGHFAGVEIEDVPHRAAEPVPHAKWREACARYAQLLHNGAGTKAGLQAMHNSMTAIEMLTCEGLLGILSHAFVDGALPDIVHLPNGIPLLIAFAVRVACYPMRYGLVAPTKSDLIGINEIVSLFESNWIPLSSSDTGEVKFYAIDAAIKAAYKDADTAAAKHSTRQAVVDNLSFWHRAGQRCISTIFGLQVVDYFPPESPYGRCEALQDPLHEARQKVMRTYVGDHDYNPFADSAAALNMASTAQKKHTLLLLMSSVEEWLRSGQYCGQQISHKNSPDGKARASIPRVMRKREFQRILNVGVERSVQEMMDAGDCEREEDARLCADAVRETIETALAEHGNETNVMFSFDDDPSEADVSSSVTEDASDTVSSGDICLSATGQAASAIAAALCQGPMVHHQFGMSCFLSGEHATNQCADCDATVHVLTATFLCTRFGGCPRCCRARCTVCENSAIRHLARTGKVKGAEEGCLRCSKSAAVQRTGKASGKNNKKKK